MSPSFTDLEKSDESRIDCAIAACLVMGVLHCCTALFGDCAIMTLRGSFFKRGSVDLA